MNAKRLYMSGAAIYAVASASAYPTTFLLAYVCGRHGKTGPVVFAVAA